MATFHTLTEGLRESLLRALAVPPPPRDLHQLVQVCHALALTTIRQNLSGRFASELHNVAPAQLAYDCIADLFIRQEDGRLPKIASYFDAFEPATLTDQQVLQHLRRLVGGAVHQGLFRIDGEIDPSLGKILRNVKLAVQSLGHFKVVDHFGEPCIAPAFCETLQHLGTCPLDELERGVLAHTVRARTVPDLLSALAVFLRSQSTYSRVVSTIDVARVFRSVFSRLVDVGANASQEPHDAWATLDLPATIAWACVTVRRKMQKAYVSKGRIAAGTLAMYHATIEQYLRAKLNGEGDQTSLRAHFHTLHPELPISEFRTHRARLEYMTRLAERLIYERLRK